MSHQADDDSMLYLVRYTKGCEQCNNRDRYDRRWEFHRLVREKGRFKAEGVIKCKYCGNVMEILPQLIKVELKSLYCKQCEGHEFLLDIDRLEQAAEGFEFSIFIDCKNCSKRVTFFKRTKKAIRSLKTVKLSLTGMEFEFFSPDDEPKHDVQLRTYRWSEYSQLPPRRRLP